MLRLVLRLGGALPLLVILLMPAASPAAAQATRPTTTVSIVSGVVVTGGAGITLRYSCFPGGYGPYSSFGDVRVGQVSGATGDGFFHPICSDRTQTSAVFVPGNFTKGDAAVSAFVCGFDCNSATKEIRLK
jgi:hypothetical protein